MRPLILILLTLLSLSAWADQSASVSIDRSWGLLLGDKFTVNVTLPVDSSKLDKSALPDIDKRYGNWLFLKAIELNHNNMQLHYQVVNVSTHNITIDTPELKLITLQGLPVDVPSTKLTIGPILADGDNAGSFTAQPDHAAQPLNTQPVREQLLLAFAVMIISILVLVIWHIGWKPRNRAPFAQAVFDLTKMKWLHNKDVDKAARILHAAFNGTAGTVVVYSELDKLLTQVTWLDAMRGDIDTFFSASTNRFFSRDAQQALQFDAMLKLAKACRAREKLA